MASANSKMADKICVNCYRFSFRIMHFFNRETIYILKTQNESTDGRGNFQNGCPQFQDGRHEKHIIAIHFE